MRKLLFSLLVFFTVVGAFAQQKQLTGTVKSKASWKAIPDVTVQGPKAAAVTDANGKFTIAASSGDVIFFTHIGMKSFSLKVKGSETDVVVELEDDAQSLNDVVVMGYTTEKKKDIKGAVTVVKIDDALKETNSNLFTSLQGRVPGLDVSTDGAPGSGVFVNIRGLGSINTNTPPLIIIDGVPTYDFNGLSPNDIESLQVLKDAASAAIYGARASSGVIIITTKKGKTSKPKVTFDTYYGSKSRRGGVI